MLAINSTLPRLGLGRASRAVATPDLDWGTSAVPNVSMCTEGIAPLHDVHIEPNRLAGEQSILCIGPRLVCTHIVCRCVKSENAVFGRYGVDTIVARGRIRKLNVLYWVHCVRIIIQAGTIVGPRTSAC